MIPLPNQPETENIRVLASLTRERITGVAGVTLTLTHEVALGFVAGVTAGIEHVVKNGTTLDTVAGAGGYTVSGKTITLGTAAIVGDVFHVWYYARSGT